MAGEAESEHTMTCPECFNGPRAKVRVGSIVRDTRWCSQCGRMWMGAADKSGRPIAANAATIAKYDDSINKPRVKRNRQMNEMENDFSPFPHIRKRILERRLNRAVRIKALTQIEADTIMEEAEAVGFDPLIMIQIIMFVIELIRMWAENRRAAIAEAEEG